MLDRPECDCRADVRVAGRADHGVDVRELRGEERVGSGHRLPVRPCLVALRHRLDKCYLPLGVPELTERLPGPFHLDIRDGRHPEPVDVRRPDGEAPPHPPGTYDRNRNLLVSRF
ncbi:MAG: hypothetical protein BRD21_01485 [Halobacteriales archaeon SW_8_66_22]|nr:MAG: hypothetical protein BRD21_01485 [Halobacteriales archaeon SW_8_66_22]